LSASTTTSAAAPTVDEETAAPGPYDLLVIGGGSAGLIGARTAASLGASVLLVERDRVGGDCLWTGCVPSKALLAAASVAATARDGVRFGVHAGEVKVDFAGVLAHVHGAMAAIAPVDSPEQLQADGVEVRHGSAQFTGLRSAEVDGEPVQFRQALIATGSDPVLPPIPGLADAGALTSDSVWDLDELPERLVVLGGGSIGCELGQAFARLGAAVTVVEGLDRLLPREDPDAARLVTAALERDGVTAVTGERIVEVDGATVVLANGRHIVGDRLLVAVGRRPDTAGLAVEAAGVELDDRGFVAVDARLRTSNPRVWAAGDVTGHPQFTHVAGVHGSTAAANAILGLRRSAEVRTIPRVTFTSPEVGAVGLGADAPDVTVRTYGHDEVDRAVAEGQTGGFARLVLDRRGRVVGATLVGPRAGEALAEVTLAVRRGLPIGAIADTIHAYPTFADGPWNAAIGAVRARLQRPGLARVTGALAAVRRQWLDLR